MKHDKSAVAKKHESIAISHQKFKGLTGSYLYLLTMKIKKIGSGERNNKINAYLKQNSKYIHV